MSLCATLALLLTTGLFPQNAKADSLVVETCGTLPKAYAPGATRLDTVDINGNKCGSAVVGSYDSGPISVTGAVNSSSHAAGTSVGGLLSVPIARVNGGSGIITGLQWLSPGGSTGQLVLRAWTKSPLSTCTDQTAYANNSADDPYLLPGTPLAITPVAPAVTTGDARTYAPVTGLTWDYKNVDINPSQNVYFCVITVSTDTADESSSVRLTVSGPQN